MTYDANNPEETDSGHVVYPMDKEDMARLVRLIIEGLEVALYLCNNFLSKFGPSRILDILEQILPSAYVINTSYWPLYQAETGTGICICSIFDMPCPHVSNGLSRIDLDREVNELVLFKNGIGTVSIEEFTISVSKRDVKKHYLDSTGQILYTIEKAYEIELTMKPLNTLFDGVDEYVESIKCVLRFELTKPTRSFNKFCLWISPHPIFTDLYGFYFSCLVDHLVTNKYPNTLIVTWDQCPDFTIKISEKSVSKISTDIDPMLQFLQI